MPTYIYRDGKLVDKATWVDPPPKRSAFPTPAIKAPFQPYTSPIDGKPIMNERQRDYDLKANDCIPWEPGINQDANKKVSKRGGGGRNPNWSRKYQRPMKDGVVQR